MQIIENRLLDVDNTDIVNGIFRIPFGVKYTGVYAFEYCTSLQKVVIPNTVKGIANSAFKNCKSLKEINLPDSIEHIGASAFCDCTSLKKVLIPNTVTRIMSFTFQNCQSLEELHLSSNILFIDCDAFQNCKNLDFDIQTSLFNMMLLDINPGKQIIETFDVKSLKYIIDKYISIGYVIMILVQKKKIIHHL